MAQTMSQVSTSEVAFFLRYYGSDCGMMQVGVGPCFFFLFPGDAENRQRRGHQLW